MEEIKEKYDYEPFADTVEYREVNEACINEWGEIMRRKCLNGFEAILDIATGAGTMVQLVFNHLPKSWKKAAVICLDQSAEALRLAQSNLEKTVERLRFVHSSVEDMKLPDESIDVAFWGNGIHYLSEQEQLDSVKRIKRALKPGGLFFFNTAFYEEARPSDTLAFYRTQVKNAVQYLRDRGISRQRDDSRTEASKFLPRAYYEQMVREAGFKLVEVKEYAVDMRREAWEYISSFQQYAAGALRGYPVDAAVQAMKEAVKPALEQHGYRDGNGNLYITRKWLAISTQA
jgi:ubiquinone/menaquinone biosynthesis C-methylase UbiE